MNKVFMIGRLVSDVNDKGVVTLAINRGKDQEAYFIPTYFHPETFTNLFPYLQKGTKIAVDGELRSYKKDEEAKLIVGVKLCELLGNGKVGDVEEGEEEEEPQPSKKAPAKNKTKKEDSPPWA